MVKNLFIGGHETSERHQFFYQTVPLEFATLNLHRAKDYLPGSDGLGNGRNAVPVSVDSTCARLRSHLESSPSSAFVCHCPACAHSTSAHLLSPLPSTSARSRENPTTMLTSDITNTYLKCNPQFSYTQASNPKRVLTKPSKPVLNDGHDNADSDYILYVNDVLGSQEGQQLSRLAARLPHSCSIFEATALW
ncbi:hypothetical protein BC830DRAFT_1165322 [Chytriomyces sp. MP71]|nr:hypothetical protein BC830DRAFT_1165322 [Chytriomyces sp. MP71]